MKLPYFDLLLAAFDKGNANVEKAFGRHVHWGYWENPQSANGTIEDFSHATEKLSQLICDAADIKEHMRVLDVGCGFGGTIASLNERFSPVGLVGFNLDHRQLKRAQKRVLPFEGNKLAFVHGNASELPFAANAFDVVLAVEAIFHFPHRQSFFKEVFRVLRPEGRFAFSDFVLSKKTPFVFNGLAYLVRALIATFYGKIRTCTMEDYACLAKSAGLKAILDQDITTETMPTYDILNGLLSTSVLTIAAMEPFDDRLMEPLDDRLNGAIPQVERGFGLS